MRYRKKPIVIDAYQWFKNGDHPEVVRYFRHPNVSGTVRCQYCHMTMHDHGWIDTLEGGHVVCPGDWIITGIKGENYPCKPDIFENSYLCYQENGQYVLYSDIAPLIDAAKNCRHDCYCEGIDPLCICTCGYRELKQALDALGVKSLAEPFK